MEIPMGFLVLCYYSLLFLVGMVILAAIVSAIAACWPVLLVVAIIIAIIMACGKKKPTPAKP